MLNSLPPSEINSQSSDNLNTNVIQKKNSMKTTTPKVKTEEMTINSVEGPFNISIQKIQG